MTKRLAQAFMLAVLIFSPGNAFADACSDRARAEVAKSPGAELLSVNSRQQSGGQVVCVIRIKLASKDGKPGRVVTRTIKP